MMPVTRVCFSAQVLRLWEALWAGPGGPHFHIYVCAAVLIQHRKQIVEGGLDFDVLLLYCIDLRGHIDLQQALRDAEVLALHAGKAGQAIIAALGPETTAPASR